MNDPFLPPVKERDEDHLDRVMDILHERHADDIWRYFSALVAYRIDAVGVDSIMPNDYLEKLIAMADSADEEVCEDQAENSRSA